MSLGYTIAIHAVPFFDLLDREVKTVAEAVFGSAEEETSDAAALALPPGTGLEPRSQTPAGQSVDTVMATSRRRLAMGVDAFVRRLPSAVRNDSNTTRAAAYALVGLADERMLHYPTGGLDAWGERLLESELYGSALAGQEIIRQARLTTQQGEGGVGLLAPLYLAILREGFEGSLRGDVLSLSSLTSILEDSVGAIRGIQGAVANDIGPKRVAAPLGFLAIASFALWLGIGPALWWVLAEDSLSDANRVTERIEAGLAATLEEPMRPISPTRLPTDSR